MGANPPHGTGPGKFSTQGRAADHGETAKETEGGGMGISTTGVRNGGGGLQGDQGIHTKEAEHTRAIYCDATNSEPLQKVGTDAGSLGFLEVVGTRGDRPRGCKEDGGGGYRTVGGEGRRRVGAVGDDGQ